MGRRQQQPGKKICFTRKRNHRRHSAPAAMQLNVPLNEILYGKSYQSKKMRKAKEMEQMAEKLQGHVKYFEMIDEQELFVTSEVPKLTPTVERSLEKVNLTDPKLLTEYKEYQEATEAFVEPVPLEEFAKTIRPCMARSVYDGYLATVL